MSYILEVPEIRSESVLICEIGGKNELLEVYCITYFLYIRPHEMNMTKSSNFDTVVDINILSWSSI